MTIGPQVTGGRVYHTQWGVRAIQKARRIRHLIGFPANPIQLYSDWPEVNVSFLQRVIAITMQQDTRTILNHQHNSSDDRMVVEVHVGNEYIVVSREGDLWEFDVRPGNPLERVIIYVILVDLHVFTPHIPVDIPVHLLSKAGYRHRVVVDIPDAAREELLNEVSLTVPADVITTIDLYQDEILKITVENKDYDSDAEAEGEGERDYAFSDILLIPR